VLVSRVPAALALGLVDLGPHRRLGQVAGDLGDSAVTGLAALDDSALNLAVNDRRGRGLFFARVSTLDIPSGASPHLVDVRQTVLTPFF
jgi:hypothetical protein